MSKKSFILIIFAGLIIYISIQNNSPVTIHFLFWQFSLSLMFLIYITFISGIMTGIILYGIKRHSASNKNKKQHSEEATKRPER